MSRQNLRKKRDFPDCGWPRIDIDFQSKNVIYLRQILSVWEGAILWEITAVNKRRCIMSWDRHWELPGSEIASLQIIRADAWQDPTTTANWWRFFLFGNTLFSGSWVAKQRKLTFSWLLINCMTALGVCYEIIDVIRCLLTYLTLTLLC